MKLLVQSDDYGITRAVSLGCIHGIRNGVVRNTGMFANMPWIAECVDWIRPYLDQIALLTHEDGTFLGSKENRALDTEENDHDHLAAHRDELYAEFKAQIERYIELVGHKPDYIHNHAYGTKTTDEVTRTLAKEYGVLCSVAFMDREEVKEAGMGWYVWGGPEAQLNEDPITYITEDKGGILDKEYGYIVSHCGYADADLFGLTSFSLCRVKDLEAMTSTAVKNWVKENNIELASFKDLPKEWL